MIITAHRDGRIVSIDGIALFKTSIIIARNTPGRETEGFLTGHLHFLNFIDRPNDEREISVKGAVEHIPHITLAFGGLFLAMRTDFPAQRSGIVQYIIAVGCLNDVHNVRKIFFQPAVKLWGKAAITVTVAVDTLHADFLLHCLPILSKHNGSPSYYESQSSNSLSELSIGNELKFLFSWFFLSDARTVGVAPRTTYVVIVTIIVIAPTAVKTNHIPFFIGVIVANYISTFLAFIVMLESYVDCFLFFFSETHSAETAACAVSLQSFHVQPQSQTSVAESSTVWGVFGSRISFIIVTIPSIRVCASMTFARTFSKSRGK
jgi:hypothetical protein